jgi:hypothetical protein
MIEVRDETMLEFLKSTASSFMIGLFATADVCEYVSRSDL